MRSIHQLPTEVCHQLAGVVFDVDDTLTDHGQLTEVAYGALWALARRGLLLVAVTGRPLGWCDVFARQWPIAAAVGENGGGWVFRQTAQDQGQGGKVRIEIVDGYFDDEVTRAGQHLRLAALEKTALATIPGLRLASDHRLRRVDLAFDVAEEAPLDPAALDRLLALIAASGARALVSSVHAHAYLGAHDKASGAARAIADAIGRDLAAERERWLFIGDSGNDAAAFAYFPVSAAVANVRANLPRLPVPPVFVADQERGHGFAEIAAAILARRTG
jgi:HAD superfamily hydrolase (TIGR01484 family)